MLRTLEENITRLYSAKSDFSDNFIFALDTINYYFCGNRDVDNSFSGSDLLKNYGYEISRFLLDKEGEISADQKTTELMDEVEELESFLSDLNVKLTIWGE